MKSHQASRTRTAQRRAIAYVSDDREIVKETYVLTPFHCPNCGKRALWGPPAGAVGWHHCTACGAGIPELAVLDGQEPVLAALRDRGSLEDQLLAAARQIVRDDDRGQVSNAGGSRARR